MHPLVRWQYRGGIPEKDRKAFLFTHPTDGKGIATTDAFGGRPRGQSRRVPRGLRQAARQDRRDLDWRMASPIPPRVVETAPCHDIVTIGDALDAPAPARRRARAHLDAGLRQCALSLRWPLHHQGSRHRRSEPGNYRGQLKSPRRLGMNPSVELRAGIYTHWLKYKARGEPMPCAVVSAVRQRFPTPPCRRCRSIWTSSPSPGGSWARRSTW